MKKLAILFLLSLYLTTSACTEEAILPNTLTNKVTTNQEPSQDQKQLVETPIKKFTGTSCPDF